MKTRFYFVLSALFLLAANFGSFAQDDVYGNNDENYKEIKEQKQSGKKINTGYVFIDGKYVEPPYIVKRKKMHIFINDIKVSQDFIMPKDPFNGFDTRYAVPENLNKSSTLIELYECKEPQRNWSYYMYMNNYFVKRYEYKIAMDSLVAYVGCFPNVKSAERINDNQFRIILYNCDTADLLFPMELPNSVNSRQIWGYGGKREKQVRKNYKFQLNQLSRKISTFLLNDEIIFFDEFSKLNLVKIVICDSLKNILNDSEIYGNKDLSKSIISPREFIDIFFEQYRDNNSFKTRFDKKIENSNEITHKSTEKNDFTHSLTLLENGEANSIKNLDLNFSPANRQVGFYNPNAIWESTFSDFQTVPENAANITICPSTKDIFPANNTIVITDGENQITKQIILLQNDKNNIVNSNFNGRLQFGFTNYS